MNKKALLGAVTVTALLALYIYAIWGRAHALMGTGEPVGIAIGIGVLIIPLLAVGLIAREWWLGVVVQRMADQLAQSGELPVDDLPRSPGGRIDRDAADAAFVVMRERVEAEPGSWKAWYNVAFAYDAARDRKRARAALRTAARLYKTP
ncbi:hypothetical protein SAMN05216410_2200 [Sanguibacter gelidistatuariae]|uniref:Tetratricopeptide repeat-containing protein n=1 Tax=Sanguibacter gelidistatuariae TaxID=1814289 RepID=A0A1G6NQT5_9MICO|nr:hypothetical protein [Sanguibacter gelidistatuariae]SDC69734.1 hypothetical protein SAMN05216410_2200 [Sanguibacter gelidistatuariae]